MVHLSFHLILDLMDVFILVYICIEDISVIDHVECLDNAEVIDQVVEQAARGGRDFGDIGSILAIAGTFLGSILLLCIASYYKLLLY